MGVSLQENCEFAGAIFFLCNMLIICRNKHNYRAMFCFIVAMHLVFPFAIAGLRTGMGQGVSAVGGETGQTGRGLQRHRTVPVSTVCDYCAQG